MTITEKKFANLRMYSDVVPFEVVRVVSGKTVEIREMKAELDPNWKPEMVVGGFSAHCTNQASQKWIFESNPSAPIIRCRKVKARSSNFNLEWKSEYGHHYMEAAPRKFHDYNF